MSNPLNRQKDNDAAATTSNSFHLEKSWSSLHRGITRVGVSLKIERTGSFLGP